MSMITLQNNRPNYKIEWLHMGMQPTDHLSIIISKTPSTLVTPFSNENDTALFRIRSTLQCTMPKTNQRKWINSKILSRVEWFENGTVWKRCFPSVDGENDAIWKWWCYHNNTAWLQTTQSWVSKIADSRFLVASLLIVVIFSLLTILKAHLTLLRLFDFSRGEQDIIKLLRLQALGGTRITKTTRSKPDKTWMVLDNMKINVHILGQLQFVVRKVMEEE